MAALIDQPIIAIIDVFLVWMHDARDFVVFFDGFRQYYIYIFEMGIAINELCELFSRWWMIIPDDIMR